ncbi:MAG: Cj0069 family protein [Rhodospirillaceae bacterium]
MPKKIAILFPADGAADAPVDLSATRYADIAAALRDAGLEVEAAPYADAAVDAVRQRLLGVDGVLVWVNLLDGAGGRVTLNAMLDDVARQGVYVSAHPDVIRKLGTKAILHETRTMAWGSDTRYYRSPDEMRAALPGRLAAFEACVLKQVRGNGGDGVWEVSADAGDAALVRVRHAKRGSVEETMPQDAFLANWAPYFAATGAMIDQPYQPRLADGMTRCYMVHDRVAGFGEQLVNALHPTIPDPGKRLYYPPTRADMQSLKDRLEGDWLPDLCRRMDIDRRSLPAIWDADFLYGPKDAAGADTYILCEVNVSSVYPFPGDALIPMAEAVAAIL